MGHFCTESAFCSDSSRSFSRHFGHQSKKYESLIHSFFFVWWKSFLPNRYSRYQSKKYENRRFFFVCIKDFCTELAFLGKFSAISSALYFFFRIISPFFGPPPIGTYASTEIAEISWNFSFSAQNARKVFRGYRQQAVNAFKFPAEFCALDKLA